MKVLERKQGRLALRFQLVWMGQDACLIVTGGEKPHLGAVALAQARESMAEPGKISSTVSNLTLLGHKDDVLSREIAKRFAASAATNVAVCCGIHLGDITAEEIKEVIAMSNAMVDEMARHIAEQNMHQP